MWRKLRFISSVLRWILREVNKIWVLKGWYTWWKVEDRGQSLEEHQKRKYTRKESFIKYNMRLSHGKYEILLWPCHVDSKVISIPLLSALLAGGKLYRPYGNVAKSGHISNSCTIYRQVCRKSFRHESRREDILCAVVLVVQTIKLIRRTKQKSLRSRRSVIVW